MVPQAEDHLMTLIPPGTGPGTGWVGTREMLNGLMDGQDGTPLLEWQLVSSVLAVYFAFNFLWLTV